MFSISDTGITGYAHIKEREGKGKKREGGKEGEERGEKTGKKRRRKRGKVRKRIWAPVLCNMEELTKRDHRINHEVNVNS